MTITFLSVCSGIEAASVAWKDLGWTAAGFAEIDKGPSRVLAHHYGSNMPDEPPTHNGVPNFGDFTKIPLETLGRVDLLVGGTPCQAFSVAGKRLSLDDARGNLSLSYVVLAHELARSHGLRVALWENVPGVLSTKDNAFGCFLGGLVGSDDPLSLPRGIERWPDAGMASGPRARLAWRVLDAQYFGLAQRRRRVFVVASFGDGPDPAAVLFERQGVRRNPPSRQEARKNLAPTISARTRGGGGLGTDAELDGALLPVSDQPMAFGGGNCSGPIDPAATLTAKGQRIDFEVETFVTQQATAFDTTQITHPANRSNPQPGDPCHPLAAGAHAPAVVQPYTLAIRGRGDTHNLEYRQDGTANALLTPNGGRAGIGVGAIAHRMAVRRLTPVECERLQGFPDDYTACLKSDGPRYKALGNSFATNVVRWIGRRIDAEIKRGGA